MKRVSLITIGTACCGTDCFRLRIPAGRPSAPGVVKFRKLEIRPLVACDGAHLKSDADDGWDSLTVPMTNLRSQRR